MKPALLHIPSLKGALATVMCHFKSWENGAISTRSQKHVECIKSIWWFSNKQPLLIVLISSERVRQRRHSDEERADPVWAAAEATYILSGTPHHSEKMNPLVRWLKSNMSLRCIIFFRCLEFLSHFETLNIAETMNCFVPVGHSVLRVCVPKCDNNSDDVHYCSNHTLTSTSWLTS